MKYTFALFVLSASSAFAAKVEPVLNFDFDQKIDAPSLSALPAKPAGVSARQNSAVMHTIPATDQDRGNHASRTNVALPLSLLPTPVAESGFPAGHLWFVRGSSSASTLSSPRAK